MPKTFKKGGGVFDWIQKIRTRTNTHDIGKIRKSKEDYYSGCMKKFADRRHKDENKVEKDILTANDKVKKLTTQLEDATADLFKLKKIDHVALEKIKNDYINATTNVCEKSNEVFDKRIADEEEIKKRIETETTQKHDNAMFDDEEGTELVSLGGKRSRKSKKSRRRKSRRFRGG